MNLKSKSLGCCILSGWFLLQSSIISADSEAVFSEAVLSLQRAIQLAQQNDPWLVQSQQAEGALLAKGISASALPDPKLSIEAANLPTDGFDFNQEPMTQLKLGYSQMFPAGDSLKLKGKKLTQSAAQFPILRQARVATIEKEVGSVWLELFRVNKSIELIKQNQVLFEQLVDVAQASYSTAVGKTRQQDIVRAQLELTLLQERLSGLSQQREIIEEQITEWVSDNFIEHYLPSDYSRVGAAESHIVLPATMPQGLLRRLESVSAEQLSRDQATRVLMQHPEILALDQKVKVDKTSIALAEQSYKPNWGLKASYAYRDDDPFGSSRSDFLSVGVSIELPIFADNKQDQQLKAAKLEAEVSKTQKWQAMRKMLASKQMAVARYKRLRERERRYKTALLPQMQGQAEAALNAYTNDEGDFAEVVRARIAELNAKIDALNIAVEKQQSILEINYYLVGVK